MKRLCWSLWFHLPHKELKGVDTQSQDRGHTPQPGHPTALSVDARCAGQTEGPLLSAAL